MPLIKALRQTVAACACGLALLTTPAFAVVPDAPAPVAVGRPLPDVVMAGLNGPHRSLSSYRGRPLIINVWASWCGPCRDEAASLERLSWSEAGSRYVVIGISTDDDRNAALKWLRHSNATVSHYIDSEADAGTHARRLEHPAHGARRCGRPCRREVLRRPTMGQRRIDPGDRARVRRRQATNADALGVVGDRTSECASAITTYASRLHLHVLRLVQAASQSRFLSWRPATPPRVRLAILAASRQEPVMRKEAACDRTGMGQWAWLS